MSQQILDSLGNQEDLWGVISSALALIGGVLYWGYIVRGRVKPLRIVWLIWAVGNTLLAFSDHAAEGGNTGWMAWALVVEYWGVVLLSIRFGENGKDVRSFWCLVGMIVAAIVWFFTKNPTIALALLILIDSFGAYGIYAEVRENPSREPWLPWAFTVLGCLANLPAINWTHLEFANASYPIYMVGANILIVSAFRPRPEKE